MESDPRKNSFLWFNQSLTLFHFAQQYSPKFYNVLNIAEIFGNKLCKFVFVPSEQLSWQLQNKNTGISAILLKIFVEYFVAMHAARFSFIPKFSYIMPEQWKCTFAFRKIGARGMGGIGKPMRRLIGCCWDFLDILWIFCTFERTLFSHRLMFLCFVASPNLCYQLW